MNSTMPLASYIAKSGIASRRSAQMLIRSGQISVNGNVTTDLSTRITVGHDSVLFNKSPLIIQKKRYFLLHKPKGYICTVNDKYASKLIYELVDSEVNERLFSIGRLDKDSEGLLLLTNDGELSNKLTHPKYQIPKVYVVIILGVINKKELYSLKKGIIEGGELLKANSVNVVSTAKGRSTLKISVSEGKKREIRRMCSYFGYPVKQLRRISFGPLILGEFKPGLFRELTVGELAKLQQSVCPN